MLVVFSCVVRLQMVPRPRIFRRARDSATQFRLGPTFPVLPAQPYGNKADTNREPADGVKEHGHEAPQHQSRPGKQQRGHKQNTGDDDCQTRRQPRVELSMAAGGHRPRHMSQTRVDKLGGAARQPCQVTATGGGGIVVHSAEPPRFAHLAIDQPPAIAVPTQRASQQFTPAPLARAVTPPREHPAHRAVTLFTDGAAGISGAEVIQPGTELTVRGPRCRAVSNAAFQVGAFVIPVATRFVPGPRQSPPQAGYRTANSKYVRRCPTIVAVVDG